MEENKQLQKKREESGPFGRLVETYGVWFLAAITLCIFTNVFAMYKMDKSETAETYFLSEVEDNVYAVLADENTVMLRFADGDEVQEFTGEVYFSYTEEEPYVIVKEERVWIVPNSIYVYVPEGSVEFAN